MTRWYYVCECGHKNYYNGTSLVGDDFPPPSFSASYICEHCRKTQNSILNPVLVWQREKETFDLLISGMYGYPDGTTYVARELTRSFDTEDSEFAVIDQLQRRIDTLESENLKERKKHEKELKATRELIEALHVKQTLKLGKKSREQDERLALIDAKIAELADVIQWKIDNK
ncbi:MAG: hypothetical protein ACYCQJ_07680 [Nitrososphaerales archaeon]